MDIKNTNSAGAVEKTKSATAKNVVQATKVAFLLGSIILLPNLNAAAGQLTANAANSQKSSDGTSTTSPAWLAKSVPTTDGAAFIDKCFKAANAYTDYSFDYSQTVFKDKGKVTETGTILVKKPQLKAIARSGPKAGSVAILLPDGQVKAHGGGAFKFITVTLPASNDNLRSANGWPLVESDFASVWKAMQKYSSADKCPSKVTAEAVFEPTQKQKVLVLEMTKPGGEIYKRALVDPATNIPVEWWDYQNGKLFAHSLWTNFKGNQGLSDKIFSTTKIEKGEK